LPGNDGGGASFFHPGETAPGPEFGYLRIEAMPRRLAETGGPIVVHLYGEHLPILNTRQRIFLDCKFPLLPEMLSKIAGI